jgi:hypothetical protein
MSLFRTRLFDVTRDTLLRSLARGITELTVRNRAYYRNSDAASRLMEGNEAIHRLNGHVRDLLDPAEELTESRKNGIIEALSLLSPPTLDRVIAPSPRAR